MAADITKGYAALLGRCFQIRTIHLCLISHPPRSRHCTRTPEHQFPRGTSSCSQVVGKYCFIDFSAKMLLQRRHRMFLDHARCAESTLIQALNKEGCYLFNLQNCHCQTWYKIASEIRHSYHSSPHCTCGRFWSRNGKTVNIKNLIMK